MSFFAKIFGGDEKKKEEKKKQPQKPTTVSKQIAIEKTEEQLDKKIKLFQDHEKKNQHKIDILKQKAKELLEADKKKQAKRLIQEATKISKQVENIRTRRKVLEDKKFQLEQAKLDMDTIDGLESAQTHIKQQESNAQKMENLIADSQQAKIAQNEVNDRMVELLGQDEDQEADDMLNELMNEVKKQKNDKIAKKEVNVEVKGNAQLNKKQANQKDELEKMLNAI